MQGAGHRLRKVLGDVLASMAVVIAGLLLCSLTFAQNASAEPIKVGFSLPLTGPEAENGKQLLLALELWRDDVNASGGLLGRPVDLVYYDDAGNPGQVPRLYYRLISDDRADLLLGPYGRSTGAAAMRTLLNFGRVTIGFLGIGVNRVFSYRRYFAMTPTGSEGVKALSNGFFDLAAEQEPKPRTVSILAANNELMAVSAAAANENASAYGFDVIYEKSFPVATKDFTSVVQAAKSINADVVFIATDQRDTLGILQTVNRLGLTPKMLGGYMTGLASGPIKEQLGPQLNGIVSAENFGLAKSLRFPGIADVLKRYRAAAAREQADPLGYDVAPFGYSAGQVLAQAVKATQSLDPDKLADYMHHHSFSTVLGNIAFNEEGEWTDPRVLFTQFQNVANVEQFAGDEVQPILWPPRYATGHIIYPYITAKQ